MEENITIKITQTGFKSTFDNNAVVSGGSGDPGLKCTNK